jgi:hypothetical protein
MQIGAEELPLAVQHPFNTVGQLFVLFRSNIDLPQVKILDT